MHKESSIGILLLVATVLAMVFANSPLHVVYDYFLKAPSEIRPDGKSILPSTLLIWINDGLMAVFFLLIGLEVKREVKLGA